MSLNWQYIERPGKLPLYFAAHRGFELQLEPFLPEDGGQDDGSHNWRNWATWYWRALIPQTGEPLTEWRKHWTGRMASAQSDAEAWCEAAMGAPHSIPDGRAPVSV